MKESYESFKTSRWFPLVTGVVSIILGIICVFNPQVRMESIAMVAGIVFLLYGILQILNGIRIKENTALRILFIALGVIVVILAIVAFANLSLIGKYLPTLVGFFMILCAVSNLVPSLTLLKNGIRSWWYSALPAVILLILGLVFLLKPGFVGQTFGIYSGIALLINGVSSLVSFAQFKK